MLSLVVLCPSLAFGAKAAAPKQSAINVIIDGEAMPGVSAYTITDKTKFFSIREAAEIYNATLEWKPVSSQVTMRINNKKIDIKADSNVVVFGKKSKKMGMPSRLIKNELYISPEILESTEFAEFAEADTTWNQDASILTVNHRSNIASVRYFTKADSTEIVIQLEDRLPYTVLKSSGALVLNVHRGQIQRDFIYPNNGAVKDVTYETKGKVAEFVINLQQTPKVVKSMLLKNPYRIVIDIEHSKPVDVTALKETTIPELDEYAALPDDIKSAVAVPVEQYGEAQITEVVAAVETDANNQDLASVPVVKYDAAIVDDSYSIIDDTTTVPEVMPKKAAASKTKDFQRRRIIVIDAGHGGEDPGAVGPNGTKEKDINLEIVYELKKIFDNDDEYEIVLTRKDDTFIPLVDRTNIANEHHADLFVSVHCNANFNRSVNGFEIYFLSEKATDSEAAATATLENSVLELEGKPTKKRALLQEMLWSMMINEYINDSAELCSFIASETPGRLKIPNRGTKQASFYVLRGAQMPAVLVESAFLSNYAEESKLNTKKFRAAVADSIYEGIKKYYARKDKIQNGKK